MDLNFHSLPYELKEGMCRHMTVTDLAQYVATHKEAYNQCSHILKAKQTKLYIWATVVTTLIFGYISFKRSSGEYIEYNRRIGTDEFIYKGEINDIISFLKQVWDVAIFYGSSDMNLRDLVKIYYGQEAYEYVDDEKDRLVDPDYIRARIIYDEMDIQQFLTLVSDIVRKDGFIKVEPSNLEVNGLKAPEYYNMLLTTLQPVLNSLPDV